MQSALPYDPYRVSGGAAAQVFRKISDRIYFNDHELRNELATDSGKVVTLPSVSNGYANDFTVIFNELGIPQASIPKSSGQMQIAEASIDYTPLIIEKVLSQIYLAWVCVMLYMLPKCGLHVSCKGYGRLVRQSYLRDGIRKKETIVLEFN